MRKHELQIANFILTFGSKGELLDFAEEIVIPCFFDDSLVRTHGSSSYYIYEPTWIDLGSEDERELAISGRFVKDIVLTREQVFNQGKLVEDYDELQSSPSAFFVLLFRDHRLLYFSETAHAPDISAFASTMQIYLRRKWRAHLKLVHDSSSDKVTYANLRKEIPMPTLNILPLAKTGSVRSLLEGFDKVTRLKFRLIRPNHEIDASKVLQSVRDRLQPLEPARLDIELAQSEGLDPDETADAVEEAAKSMNTDIILSGVDSEGNKLKIENEDLALRIPIAHPPKTKKSLRKRLYAAFQEQLAEGSITRHSMTDKVRRKIEQLASLVL